MKLIRLKDEDVDNFKKYMQGAFQYGYKSVYSKDKSQVFFEKDMDKRNIHLYVNKLKFKMVEYYNEKHSNSNILEDIYDEDNEMFEFEKEMTKISLSNKKIKLYKF